MRETRDIAQEWLCKEMRKARIALGRAEGKTGVTEVELGNLRDKVAAIDWLLEMMGCQSASGWISVEDRSPENGKMAICKTDWFYEICQWDARSEVWFSPNHIHKKDYVTHWMPLPDAPERGDDDV